MNMPDLPKGSTADYLSLRYSHPKWLVLRLLDLVGPDETQAFLRLDNDTVPTCIQVNPLRTTAEELERELRGAGVAVQPHPWLEGCLELSLIHIYRADAFGQGLTIFLKRKVMLL